MLGVAFGVPFGRYVYTEALFPRAFGVPLVMGAALHVLFAFVKQMRLPPWMGAVVMTAIDLVIDPLATRALGYWTWEAPGIYYGIPASNFAGWFLVSLLLFTLARRPLALRPRVFWLGWSVLLFFAVIALGVGLVLPGLIGVALLALSRHWRPSRAGRSERSIAPAPPGSPGR
jgi:putative membrane protein